MRALLRDFFACFGRAAAFANSGNLTEALRLIQERREDEVAANHAGAAPSAAWKLMHQPRAKVKVKAGTTLRRHGRRPLLTAH